MEHARIIRKYPNRRLYDTQDSRYVALHDIQRMIQDGVPVEVLDHRTQRDITANVLLQIIIEQEKAGQTLFTLALLHTSIRSNCKPNCELIANYLEQNLLLLSRYQSKLKPSPHSQQTVDRLVRMQEDNLEKLYGKLK